jgi:hypothetical protein
MESIKVRTDQQLYEAITDVVIRAVPTCWKKIMVNASIADDNGEALYDYVDDSSNVQWFAPETSSQYEVYKAFQELRSSMTASGQSWNTARFTLERSGTFRIEFDCEK